MIPEKEFNFAYIDQWSHNYLYAIINGVVNYNREPSHTAAHPLAHDEPWVNKFALRRKSYDKLIIKHT